MATTMAINPLTPEQITELMASSKLRGLYKDALAGFVKGDEDGVEVSLTEGTFEGRKAATVVTGFKNAIEKVEGAESVRVLAHEDRVYLIKQ